MLCESNKDMAYCRNQWCAPSSVTESCTDPIPWRDSSMPKPIWHWIAQCSCHVALQLSPLGMVLVFWELWWELDKPWPWVHWREMDGTWFSSWGRKGCFSSEAFSRVSWGSSAPLAWQTGGWCRTQQLLTVVDGEDLTSALEDSPKLCFSCPTRLQYLPFPSAWGQAVHTTCPSSEMQSWGSQTISTPLLPLRISLFLSMPLTDSFYCQTSTLFIYSSTKPPAELKPAYCLGHLFPSSIYSLYHLSHPFPCVSSFLPRYAQSGQSKARSASC